MPTVNRRGQLVSDADLQRVTVGDRSPHNAPIVLAEYDPRWPQLFGLERDRIAAALGSVAERIEHVGSTAVPGLLAKPIIDILLAVPDASDEPAYVPQLEKAGYALRIREPDWFEHRMFKGPDVDINLHVFSSGCSEIARMLSFRDRLRGNDAERDQYAEAKRDLARREWRHVQHYANAKTGVIEGILTGASAAEIDERAP